MPLTAIDIATYRAAGQHHHNRWVRLVTDSETLAALPRPVREAADEIWLSPSGGVERRAQPGREVGCLLWFRGEQWLQGTAVPWRDAGATPGCTTYVPVHYGADLAWELIGVEPRGRGPEEGGTAGEERVDLRLRVKAAEPATWREEETGEAPWQQLRLILRQESITLGAGVAALAALAQAPGLPALLQALCLRNLITMLMRQNSTEAAVGLLGQAQARYPDYRELDYMEARIRLAQGRPSATLAALQRATAPAAGQLAYVGSGGESGYRAHCLLAQIAEAAGNQLVAVQHYLTGIGMEPAYAPSVAGLLQQRVPRSALGTMSEVLLQLGRRQSEYQNAIFDFLLLHRAWESARLALEQWQGGAESEARWRERLAALAPLQRPSRRREGERAGVVLEGQFLAYHSVANINRRLAQGLCADAKLEVALEPSHPGEEPARAFGAGGALAALRRLPHRLDLTIRHGWPPDFRRPGAGKLALILPWEFGAIPCEWVESLRGADEIWVPSKFVRQVLTGAGVEAARVRVIPNGVEGGVYCAAGERWRPEGTRGTCFLFVGGPILRKGMDVLLRAWREAFDAGDDVSLVIKAMGTRSFYRHLSLEQDIAAVASDPGAAPIVYEDEHWSEAKMAALFRGCDAVVLPYRGEGFGLPLAEGMACGKAVIATAAGPAPEYCPAAAGWWVKAEEREVPRRLRPPQAMTGRFTWFEPSQADLVEALRAAAADRSERERRGAAGAQAMHSGYEWDMIVERYRERIAALVE
ncbi:MAG: glycosyltransferase [Terriglobales bacterium]